MRLYRALLRLLPASFRAEYGSEMSAVFAQRRRDARGAWSAVALWADAVVDIVSTALHVHLDIFRQDLGFVGVVGVVADMRVRGLERTSEPQVYLPYLQAPEGAMGWYTPKDLVVKSDLDPETLAPALREIGVRMALGARGADILGLVLRHGLTLGALGTGLELAAALGAGRSLEALLVGVSPRDAATLLTAAGVAIATVLMGSIVPALRAIRVDPLTVLRSE